MRWPLLAILLATVAAEPADAGDFALCAQSVDAELKFSGCNGLVAREPKLAEAYSGRGLALIAMGETDRAIADYSYAIGLDPGLMVAYYNRGLSYLEIGEPALAAEDFDAVIARNPGDATAYNGRATAYAALGNYDEAEADFTRAIALDPQYARAYVSRGSLSLSRRLYDTSRIDFDRALQLDPGNADAILGRSYATTGTLPADVETVASTTPLAADLQPATAPNLPRPTVKSLAIVPRVLKPLRTASVKAETISLDAIAPSRPPLKASKAKLAVASKPKPLVDPTLAERSCNNYLGEPCAVLSK